jgi:hypothetical protein
VEIKGPVGRFLALLLNAWSTPLLVLGASRDGRFRVEILPVLDELLGKSPGIDARLAQLDHARDNLVTALQAVDELKATAEKNKRELNQALERIGQAQSEKDAAEKELESVRHIAEADVEVFKRLAGVPSRSQIARERFIGFILGVLASVVATGFVWFGAWLWEYFKS